MSSLQEPALEMWRPWSETLRAARTVWTWWWRIRATAFIAAPTGPPRPARTQLTSPSEGWGSPRAPLMSMWGLVSRFNFSASVNCSNGLINMLIMTPLEHTIIRVIMPECVFSLRLVQPVCPGLAGRRVVVSSLRGWGWNKSVTSRSTPETPAVETWRWSSKDPVSTVHWIKKTSFKVTLIHGSCRFS